VAASFGAGAAVVDARAFDRLLSFDPESGVLVCEAGASLGKIYALATPRGFHLPVQPGYPHITIGGCIAGDVHGKNPARDGTFRRQLRELTLLHPRHGVLRLDPSSAGDAFDLTCGGFGLTGHILTATLQLARLPGGGILARRHPVGRLEDAPALLAEWAPRSDFIYTWHNLASGRAFGRGFLYTGHLTGRAENAAGPSRGSRPPNPRTARYARGSLPLFGPFTARVFNHAFEWQQRATAAEGELSVFEFLFPVARRMVYFQLFGRRGFHECQLLLPRQAFPEFASRVRQAVARLGVPITLCSCKLFSGPPSLLRFDGDGICVALDFARGRAATAFAGFLDELACDLGGRPNLLKDSRLPRRVVQACFPEYDRFVTALARFDPGRQFRSELSERLGL